MSLEKRQRHITNGNCYAACSAAPGFIRLGRSPAARSHASLTHILPALVANHSNQRFAFAAAQALIRAGKTSVTTGTLCKMCQKLKKY